VVAETSYRTSAARQGAVTGARFCRHLTWLVDSEGDSVTAGWALAPRYPAGSRRQIRLRDRSPL